MKKTIILAFILFISTVLGISFLKTVNKTPLNIINEKFEFADKGPDKRYLIYNEKTYYEYYYFLYENNLDYSSPLDVRETFSELNFNELTDLSNCLTLLPELKDKKYYYYIPKETFYCCNNDSIFEPIVIVKINDSALGTRDMYYVSQDCLILTQENGFSVSDKSNN